MKKFKQLREKYNLIGDIRGIGLSIGVDIVKDRESNSNLNYAYKYLNT